MNNAEYQAVRDGEKAIGLESANLDDMAEWERVKYQEWVNDLVSTQAEDDLDSIACLHAQFAGI